MRAFLQVKKGAARRQHAVIFSREACKKIDSVTTDTQRLGVGVIHKSRREHIVP